MLRKRTCFSKTTEKDVLRLFYKSVEKRLWEHFSPHRFAHFCTNLRICTVVEQNRKTYKRMIEMMKEGKNPDPALILAVFEKAELNTFRKKFLQADVSCSDFHQIQSVYQKNNEFGLKTCCECLETIWSQCRWKMDEVAIHAGENYYEKFKIRFGKCPKHLWNTKCCAIY